MTNKSRCFSITISIKHLNPIDFNVDYDGALEFVLDLIKASGCAYWIFQHELSDGSDDEPVGYDHFQCCVNFKNPVSFSRLLKHFVYPDGGHMHLEVAISPFDLVEYCSKERTRVDGPYECENTAFKPKRKYDASKPQDAVYGGITNGLSVRQLLENKATRKYTMAHYRVVQDIIGVVQSDDVDKDAPSHKSCDYIYGASRTGKTSFVKNDEHFADDVYELNLSGGIRFAFNGYEGQSVVLIDDFRDDMIRIDELLRLLDCYAYRYEIKGGSFRYAYFSKVYITSNVPFDKLYEYADDASRDALRKRFSNGVIYEKTIDNSIPYDNYSDFVSGSVNEDLIVKPSEQPLPVPVCPDGSISDYDLLNALSARLKRSDDLELNDALLSLLAQLKKK